MSEVYSAEKMVPPGLEEKHLGCAEAGLVWPPRFWTWPDALGGLLLAVAGVFLLGSIDREIDYDEANYLYIAKSIARTGLPYLRGLDHLEREEVFITSPPLVMAVAAVSQAHWPGQLWPSRLVHVLVFSWPLYVLVWWIARRLYGPWPACFALAVLLSHTQFLGHASVVRLDVPLGLWCLVSLWCFYRALEPTRTVWLWAAGAAVSLAAAVATKFQAICIPLALGLFLVALGVKKGWQPIRPAWRPLILQGCAGVLVLAGLYWYLMVLPGPDAPQYGGGLLHTTQQMDTTGLTPRQIAEYYLALPIKAVIYLGWPLWLGLLGLLPARAEGRFAGLLAAFCAAVGLFNVAVAKLCGAGTYYLISMVPALAILAGRAAAIALQKPPTRKNFLLGGVLLGLLAWQYVADRPWHAPFGIPAGSRTAQVARFLDKIDPAQDGVLAEDTGIQFFSDRPTTVLQFAPYPAVQMYLEGRGLYPVSFVVLRASSLARPDPFLAKHWPTTQTLLQTHFDRLRCPVPGMVVFVRKGKALRSTADSPLPPGR
jgi:4-amino-4-deoxy-L-arabinose transferase-like glycosyltransferase